MFSEVFQVDVTIRYDTDNTAPYFTAALPDIKVGQGFTVGQALGQIIDDQGDSYYLEKYSISSEEELSWIVLKN